MSSLTLTSTANPLKELNKYGQSVWLDYIRRSLITSGELQRLIDEDGLKGMTSNPSIFEKAITGSTDYADILQSLEQRKDLDAMGLYERVAIRDIQDAADMLRPVYEETHFRDGYVSLECSPFLAHDTQGTMEEARRLWKAVGRENLMVKVPATAEGISLGGLRGSASGKVLPHNNLIPFLQTIDHFRIKSIVNSSSNLDGQDFLLPVGPLCQLIHGTDAPFTTRTVPASAGSPLPVPPALAARSTAARSLGRVSNLRHGVACRGGVGFGINRRRFWRLNPQRTVGDL